MSMPEPITVGVVARDRADLKRLKAAINRHGKGVHPEFVLLPLKKLRRKGIFQFIRINTANFDYWIALDDESFQECRSIHEENSKRPGYCRGFYETALPSPVVLATPESFMEAHSNVVRAFEMSS